MTNRHTGPDSPFQVAFDKDNLYVAATGIQPPGAPISAKTHAPNHGKPWNDDCVELFLTVDGEKFVQYQFIVNAAGSTMGICSEDSFDSESGSTYKGAWKAAAK